VQCTFSDTGALLSTTGALSGSPPFATIVSSLIDIPYFELMRFNLRSTSLSTISISMIDLNIFLLFDACFNFVLSSLYFSHISIFYFTYSF
jgi:hypothetical protein